MRVKQHSVSWKSARKGTHLGVEWEPTYAYDLPVGPMACGPVSIHFDRNTIATRNRQAGKAMPERPIPDQIMTELANYVATLPEGQERLFTDRFSPKRWEKIRKAMSLPELKFHDLRKTFASLLAQRGVSTAVTQRLLEHSSPQLTNDVYTNVDPVLREAVNLLPVAEWV